MPVIKVCIGCLELISDFEALHYEGRCFYCAEELEEKRANTLKERQPYEAK